MENQPVDNLIYTGDLKPATTHSRNWRDFTLVYPVIARRSKGLSIGVNLNPDRICNFDCIYCEVNRKDFVQGKHPIPFPPRNIVRPRVNLDILRQELAEMLSMVKDGSIWQDSDFANIPPNLRRINDIAFSGDGEPTTYSYFDKAVELAIEERAKAGFAEADIKLVLITNATHLSKPQVGTALKLFDAHNGEVWAKLDAGTPEYYYMIDKTTIPYERVLAGILSISRQRPINIQTCMMRVNASPPPPEEIRAYCERLKFILANGGNLKLVQLYTVARTPAQNYVTSLTDEALAEIAAQIQSKTGLAVETYGGSVGL
jgi:wyosine [tRNA(Phe)-imidazoG37] synthetase (radical SAM superfamily)